MKIGGMSFTSSMLQMLLSEDLEDKENLLGREKEDDVSLDDKSGSCCVCLSRPATVSSLNRHDVN